MTMTFKELCNYKKSDFYLKNKRQNSSILKKISKVIPEDLPLLLKSIPNINQKLFLQKSALHWAVENKNPNILQLVIEYYILNNYDLNPLYNTKDKLFLNAADYSILLEKSEHVIICYANGIESNISDIIINNNSFLSDNIKISIKNDPKYLNHISSQKNLLSIAFWTRNISLITFLLTNHYNEKEIWIEELNKDIGLIMEFKEARTSLYDSIIFFLGSHLSFNQLINLSNKGLTNNSNKDECLYYVNSLELFLSKYYKEDTEEKFKKTIMTSFNNGGEKEWLKLFNQLTHYNLINEDTPYFSSINKLHLSYSLHLNLKQKNKHSLIVKI